MIALSTPRHIGRYALLGALVLALPACNTFERMSEIGSGPSLSKIEDPQAKPGYQPVSLPMPAPAPSARNPNSLWRAGARAFLRDQRAAQVGDLLTVFITIKDSASFAATSSRSRGPNTETMGVPFMFGAESAAAGTISRMFKGATAATLVDTTSSSASAGTGTTGRTDTATMQLAAVVTQTLPNGNLVIQGKQQVKVNAEL
ncbi:MAG: flagellar basal body L-ring protein FlgH, partial [Rhodospirillaceae bacterium]